MHQRKANLAARGLGEPQGPLVLELMLHVEVLLVMEDRNYLPLRVLRAIAGALARWRDGDGRQVNLLVHVGSSGGSGRRHD